MLEQLCHLEKLKVSLLKGEDLTGFESSAELNMKNELSWSVITKTRMKS